MLEEVELPARTEHAVELVKRSGDVRDGAHRERAERGVCRLVVQRDVFAVEADELHGDRAGVEPAGRQPSTGDRGVDGEQSTNGARQVRHVEPRSEADLDQVAALARRRPRRGDRGA